jgi:hypothetical protein
MRDASFSLDVNAWRIYNHGIGTGWPDRMERNRTMSKTFKNTAFTKRSSDRTNIVACVGDTAPSALYVECNASILAGIYPLYTQNGVQYFGYR